MKAAICERYGSPDVVEVRDVDRPVAGEGELVVRVHAASVNRADLDGITPRPGFIRLFFGLRAPRNKRMGVDVAGEVEEIGPGVTGFERGDRVYGDLFSPSGAFAEYAKGPARMFRRIPESMSFDDASTLPHSAVLALQGLRRGDGRTFEPGARVLIDGASGNVGPFAVQMAKSRGAHVTGVARTAKLDFVRSLGADEVIDYTTTDYTDTGERYDWIVDTDSHHPIRRVRRALRENGTYVTLGGTSWPILAGLVAGPLMSMRSDRWSGLLLWWKPWNAADVTTVERLIADGEVRPAIDRRFPLSDIVAALRHVDDGHARGKVIVNPLRTPAVGTQPASGSPVRDARSDEGHASAWRPDERTHAAQGRPRQGQEDARRGGVDH